MNSIRRSYLWVLFPFLAACSNFMADSHYDRSVNFAEVRSYGWQAVAGQITPAAKDSTLDSRIRSAVDAVLAAKQLRLTTADQADVLLDYQASAEERVDATYLENHNTAEFMGLTYTLGTLKLRMSRGKPGVVIWEGSVQANIDRSVPAEERDRRLREAVGELLKRFPPKT